MAKHFDNYIEEILITEDQIHTRIQEIGSQISNDYQSKDLLLLGIFKGAIPFMADLARAIDLPLEMDYMAVTSYGDSAQSSGTVHIIKDLDAPINYKHVLVVEDIVDSGLTLHYLLDVLKQRNPLSLRVCSLLSKETKRIHHIDIDYFGFIVPDKFVVGYGMDYKQRYRNLPFIGAINEKTLSISSLC
jgi:hypoxanthine phosphoribosyltransferase